MNQIIQHTDQQLASQLSLQYQRLVNGMREVLIFGAMLLQIEESLPTQSFIHDDNGKLAGSNAGLKNWLEENTPNISYSTAYRFLGITKKIAEEYEQIVGARVAKTFDLPRLVLTDASELPSHAQQKQLELFDYVSGTSQRSWLDTFKGDLRRANGGKRERLNGTKRRTYLEKDFDDRLDAALQWYEYGFRNLRAMHLSPDWIHLPDVELANVCDLLKLITKTADQACISRGIVPSHIRDWDK